MHRGKWWGIFKTQSSMLWHETLDSNNQTSHKPTRAIWPRVPSCVRRGRSDLPVVTTESERVALAIVSDRHGERRHRRHVELRGRGTAGDDFAAVDASWEPIFGAGFAIQSISTATLHNERRRSRERSVGTALDARATAIFRSAGRRTSTRLDATVAADRRMADNARAQYDTGIGDRISLVEAGERLADG